MEVSEERVRRVLGELDPRGLFAHAVAATCAAWCLADSILEEKDCHKDDLGRQFKQDRKAALRQYQPAIEGRRREALHTVLAYLNARANAKSSAIAQHHFGDDLYLERVVHLALERLFVHAAAPPLLVSPGPDERGISRVIDRKLTAMLFDYPLAITHELYPLWTDAYVAAATQQQASAAEVVGVHSSWLDASGRAQRLILFDAENDLFIETPLTRPIQLAHTFLLCQSRQTHREFSKRLSGNGVSHDNVYKRGAEFADDKWECYRRWRKNDVPTPPTVLLGRNAASAEIEEAIKEFCGQQGDSEAGWVIQPRHGTEGESVSYVASEPTAAAPRDLIAAWAEIAREDDAILRPRVGWVQLLDDDGGEPRAFDFRVNVCFDGRCLHPESGYIMVSPDGRQAVASVACGGEIVSLSQLKTLCLAQVDARLRILQEIELKKETISQVRHAATQAVEALGPLALAGVDVKLDVCEGKLVPCVLDANPRPAGLLHANLFEPDGTVPGIAPSLWNRAPGEADPVR